MAKKKRPRKIIIFAQYVTSLRLAALRLVHGLDLEMETGLPVRIKVIN